ncbi:maltose alpha-D-glucosyltransferase, partial [candidate division GN15 bacterium]|nr:maltose alpha-D-glucosyltransferase [candidate division GN15 bacterium]
GYDIADYRTINPDYGSLRDFRDFLRDAHQRGIRVITELVLNHTSNEHEWFQRSRRARPGTKWRDMYVWSDTPELYKDTRIIFQDFESSNWAWDSVAQAYYWHRFYSHQPDLNFDNPYVHEQLLKLIDYWFAMGVDGLRLDAVPYLYEREGTNCENLPETHDFLKKLRKHVEANHQDKMLLAEANQWPEDAAAYFGDGDECHMAFHFPVMPRMFMALHMEDSFPVTDILRATPDIPGDCQWAMFLRNHDELTLEMVTDEERDYMYRVYARDPATKINVGIRRRLAPLLGSDRKKIELLNILLFSLPGTPVIYYGDELGMGDNYYLGDRNGVRTPMQWSPDRNAGFSTANPQKLFLPVIIDPEHHFEAVNVENQERNPSSLLWWMKRVIGMRKRFKSLSQGTFEHVSSDNPHILSFVRSYEDETILVVANLSRFSQVVELDLEDFAGYVPEEVFSQNVFPAIRKETYTLTLGPHNHYWLMLQKEEQFIDVDKEGVIPELSVRADWQGVLRGKARERLEEQILPRYLKASRWFGAKTRRIRKVVIAEEAVLPTGTEQTVMLILNVSYSEQSQDYYVLPISCAMGAEAERIREDYPQAVIGAVKVAGDEGIIFDSTYDKNLHGSLLTTIARRRKIKGKRGEFVAYGGRDLRTALATNGDLMESWPMKAEQSNSSIVYDRAFILKLYRHPDEGTNPEYEILRHLTERKRFTNMPEFAGALEYRSRGNERYTVGLLQGFIENEGDAWTYTTNVVRSYFDRLLADGHAVEDRLTDMPSLFDVDIADIPETLHSSIGSLYFELTSLLGKRTGEMHLALAGATDDAAFKPEAFSLLYQKSLHQALRSLVRRTLGTLSKGMRKLPEGVHDTARYVLNAEPDILGRMRAIVDHKFAATRARIHGDYHLGQVLYTGKDFVIIDFEGEPARTIGERRLKHSPLKDVAGMIRSFHYAGHVTMEAHTSGRPEDRPLLEPWIEPWYRYVGGVFLQAYLQTVRDAGLLPEDPGELRVLLHTFLLEKAVYELGYEMNSRPDWVVIPIKGIEYILETSL